ncbi:SVEP1 [Cordylochernes scorpioides]|uniref:SVEP1 n=1 Tax=Cordylochernes scorpioides TaxID=51811 RepID=A0ABY6LA56_9ARAC|nr:SVEP1 [Cordylochernes scorpioides]
MTVGWGVLAILLVAVGAEEEGPLPPGPSTGSHSRVEELGALLKVHVARLRRASTAELVFLVDSSSSVGADNFADELRFVRKLLADFTVSRNATRVGVVTFSSKGRVVTHVDHLSEPSNKCELLEHQLPGIGYSGGGTYTLGAMLEAQNILRNARPEADQAVFLVTDGYSNGGDPRPAARDLREAGVEVFTFGIRHGNIRELWDMAAEPRAEHSFIVDSFEEFEALARRALHEDLQTGMFEAQNPDACVILCPEDGNCCDISATCACGTHTGHFVCQCPPGYHGVGLHGQCELTKCPALEAPTNGKFVAPCDHIFHAACGAICDPGYELQGSSIRVCGADSKWTGQEAVCVDLTTRFVFIILMPRLHAESGRGLDVEPPQLECPDDVVVRASEGEAGSQVTWPAPQTSDNSGATVALSLVPAVSSPYWFPIGSSHLNYKATDPAGNDASCTFRIHVRGFCEIEAVLVRAIARNNGIQKSGIKKDPKLPIYILKPYDEEPPTVDSCLSPEAVYSMDLAAPVIWAEPLFSDNAPGPLTVIRSHSPGAEFPRGETHVTYEVQDGAGNNNTCHIVVRVEGKRQCEIVRFLKVFQQTVSKVIASMILVIKTTVPEEKESAPPTLPPTGHRIAKKELNLKAYKLLTDENKRVRLEKCRRLKHRATGQRWERILFTDEKLFTLEQAHNHQNDRSWSAEAFEHGCTVPVNIRNLDPHCEYRAGAVTCRPSCHEGYGLAPGAGPLPTVTVCRLGEGIWRPQPAFPDCSQTLDPSAITLMGTLSVITPSLDYCVEPFLIEQLELFVLKKLEDKYFLFIETYKKKGKLRFN